MFDADFNTLVSKGIFHQVKLITIYRVDCKIRNIRNLLEREKSRNEI